MSDPIAIGVAVMLAFMGLAEFVAVAGPLAVQAWRIWLERPEKKRIGF